MMFAGLISYCTGSLTCRLTGCLALTASALFDSIVQSLGIQCFDVLHRKLLLYRCYT